MTTIWTLAAALWFLAGLGSLGWALERIFPNTPLAIALPLVIATLGMATIPPVIFLSMAFK